MRLLWVSHSLPPEGRPLDNVGGIQRVALELQTALEAHPDIDLLPVVLRSAWNDRYTQVPLFMIGALREIRRRVARGEADAVLFSSMVTGSLAVPLRGVLARHDVPSALVAYGHDVTMSSIVYQRWVPHVLRSVSRVFPISNATADACLQRGLPDARCQVVTLGVDAGRFPPLSDRAAMRRELMQALGEPGAPLSPNVLLLCGVGRQVPRKGFAWFVRHVMPLLPHDVHLWLAGDGPEAPRIAQAVSERALDDRVRLLGRRTDNEIAQLYRGSDLFIMPNLPVPGDMEGFGLVMLEAGINGLPVIAARLEGITDVVSEGRNGWLVESGNAEHFARAILRYRDDRALLQHDSRSTAHFTPSTFGWQRTADQYAAALQQLVAQRPTTRRRR